MTDAALGLGAWSTACRVAARVDIAEELLRRRTEAPPARSLGVTDLVDPRTAYYRMLSPVEPTPERRAILEAGREAHLRVGHALAPARFREVRLRRDGIVGQIDLLDDGPVEIKTTSLPHDAEAVRSGRPAYVEQLAMYCALVDRQNGRLLLVAPDPHGPPAVEVYEARFRSTSAIWAEMHRRAGGLRDALTRRDPVDLPRCAWRGRGCEFESAELCGCAGTEAPISSAIRDELMELTLRPTAAIEVEQRLRDAGIGPPPAARRFRDLIYPRRAFFERTEPLTEPPAGTPTLGRPAGPEDLYRILSDLLETGPPGEMTREPTPAGEPLESIACFRGDPVLLKVTRAWSAAPPEALVRDQPQYFLDLALRCAALGRPHGWLVLGYERAPAWTDKIRVLDVVWDPLAPATELLAQRRAALEQAVAQRTAGDLPLCPRWMVDGCAYGARCGCGAPPGAGRENR
ncbi:MAG: hypothetical protein L3K06_03095 [Thermoplasmata archaeon]|nr:hypothetical protein [Thermoplasmata archaeon]